MAVDARVFGRPSPQSIVKEVMGTPSLNTTPAPAQPADVVENPNLPNYFNALDACQEILKHEGDPQRRMKVEEARVFFDSVVSEFVEHDTSTQPPAPMPMPPQVGAAMLGAQPGQNPSTGSLPTPPPPGGPVPSVPGFTTPGAGV